MTVLQRYSNGKFCCSYVVIIFVFATALLNKKQILYHSTLTDSISEIIFLFTLFSN